MIENGIEHTTHIDLMSAEYTKRLLAAPLYQKNVFVQVEIATETKEIDTILKDGTKETSHKVLPGDAIITNPDGEQYVVSKTQLEADYKPVEGKQNIYKSKGVIHALPNPTGNPVSIDASWGKKEFGGADCIFAVAIDESNPLEIEGKEIGKSRYLIGRKEFENTYKLISAE